MSNETVLQFEDVCFAYEQDEVLHNVSLKVPGRSLVAVVGPNGGGKSTMLKLALGLLRPSLGRVRVFGQKPEHARGRVGYVPQHLQFDHTFPVNVIEVVLMGRVERNLVGPYRASDRDAAMRALKRVNLAHLATRGFPDLSGGERQRVLIAQALVCDPDLLLLDEPTANVDSSSEQEIYELLHRLTERMSIVAVSHNLHVVSRQASHVACVNRTASMVPMASLTEEKLQAVCHGPIAILQHEETCHVIDPSAAMQTPHRGSAESTEDKR